MEPSLFSENNRKWMHFSAGNISHCIQLRSYISLLTHIFSIKKKISKFTYFAHVKVGVTKDVTGMVYTFLRRESTWWIKKLPDMITFCYFFSLQNVKIIAVLLISNHEIDAVIFRLHYRKNPDKIDHILIPLETLRPLSRLLLLLNLVISAEKRQNPIVSAYDKPPHLCFGEARKAMFVLVCEVKCMLENEG